MKKTITKTKSKLALLCIAAGLTANVYAQNVDSKWAIGIYGGKSEYNGDLGNRFFRPTKAYYGFGALSISKYLNKSFDLTLYGSYGDHGAFKDLQPNGVDANGTTHGHFLMRNTNADLTLKYKFVHKDNARLVPFIFAGVGFKYAKATTNSVSGFDFVLPAGLGIDLRLSQHVAMRYFASFGWTNHDYRDQVIKAQYNDFQLQHNLGFVFSFGKKKDADKDGVSDKRDKCPNTLEGALVDKEGCILDADKDGIADNFDKCPNVKGIAAFGGCPDTDGDGIEDSKDACPTVAGAVEFKGCPDTDVDGIEDAKDACPKLAGLKEFNGCPDTDKDGIEDAKDACPQVAGLAQFKGCPDTDKDGIPDNEDKCPKNAGPVANGGCPEISAKHKEILQKAMSGIQFETGKDVIKKTSYATLDNVVTVLKENPSWLVEVQGHTDNVGKYEANKALSEKRAIAVKNYLQAKGVSNKLTATGYGSDKPLEDNKTPAGRAKNRRAEFNVTYEK